MKLVERFQLGFSPRLLAASLLVGLACGAVSAFLLLLIHLLQHVLDPVHWSAAADFVVLGAVGVLVLALARVLGSPGDVEMLVDNIHVSGGATSARALRSLIPISTFTIAAGAPAGPEAPFLTTSGTLAGRFARARKLGVAETRSLTLAGMAAALALLLAAPLGSALFSLEILHRRGLQYTEALVPAVIGGLCGYTCRILLLHNGRRPPWTMAPVGALHAGDLGWAAIAGVAGAVVAVTFTYLVVGLRRVFALVPRRARPVAGGVALAALALWSSYALTFGEGQTQHVLTHRLVVSALLVALAAKLLGTSLTLASGWPGGFVIPMFFFGAVGGQLMQHMTSGAEITVVSAACMAAALVGVTKTLLGSTLIVTEIAGVHVLPTTLLAAIIAFVLTSSVGLIETQRERMPMAATGDGGDADDD